MIVIVDCVLLIWQSIDVSLFSIAFVIEGWISSCDNSTYGFPIKITSYKKLSNYLFSSKTNPQIYFLWMLIEYALRGIFWHLW